MERKLSRHFLSALLWISYHTFRSLSNLKIHFTLNLKLKESYVYLCTSYDHKIVYYFLAGFQGTIYALNEHCLKFQLFY